MTVIAPRGIVADALATAASVMGPEKALAACERFSGVELLMVYESESSEQRTVESAGFKRYDGEGDAEVIQNAKPSPRGKGNDR